MKLVVNMVMGRWHKIIRYLVHFKFEQNLWMLSLNVLVPLVKYCSMMVSFSEGLLLSEKVGLDPNTLVEVISGRETKTI
jgi:hypothetical protein